MTYFGPFAYNKAKKAIRLPQRGLWRRESFLEYDLAGKLGDLMDDNLLRQFERCLQFEPPWCTAACPFHLDVREFIARLQRGNADAAYKVFRDSVGFPAIVAALCPAPCKAACIRRESDDAIELNLLERACLAYAGRQEPNRYNVPPKRKKVAVIGAGPSGLACCLRLAAKKYPVTVFEREARLGGHLWGRLAPEIFLAEFERQFQFMSYELRLNTAVDDIAQLLGFDAVYVASGRGSADFGLLSQGNPVRLNAKTAVFFGGSLLGKDTIAALADGLDNAAAIERYVQTGIPQPVQDNCATKIQIDRAKLQPVPRVAPGQGSCYSQDELTAEAGRCLRCQCDACRTYLDLTAYYNKWPLRIKDEIQATLLPGRADLKAVPAKRLINSSNLEGALAQVCPAGIDIDSLILAARHNLHAQGKQPWGFHYFWLADMAEANGEQAALARAPLGSAKCKYAFFPGCQLGASDPRYVGEIYCQLLREAPDTGILLCCCGAPANWAGDTALHQQALAQIRRDWQALGQPTLLLACPMCKRQLRQYLPDIPLEFVYDRLKPRSSGEEEAAAYAVFDPCASREEPELRARIRELARAAGCRLEPLPQNEACQQCCSWGGQIALANPGYAESVIDKRSGESELSYLTYCANCHDIFASHGKANAHILDLLYSIRPPDAAPPTASERRANRRELKRQLLAEFWQEEGPPPDPPEENDLPLLIPPGLRKRLDQEHIFEEEIRRVVAFCESSGRKVLHTEGGYYSGYCEIGPMTYWAQYRLSGPGFELLNFYAHRMKIDLEVVWNGRRTDTDLS